MPPRLPRRTPPKIKEPPRLKSKPDKEKQLLRLENEKLRSALELLSKELETHTTAAVMNAQYVQSCHEAFEELCEEQKKKQAEQTELLGVIAKRLETIASKGVSA